MSGLEDRPRDARDALGDPDRAATERAHEAALGSAGDGRGRSRWRIARALIAASAAVGAAFAIGYLVTPSGAGRHGGSRRTRVPPGLGMGDLPDRCDEPSAGALGDDGERRPRPRRLLGHGSLGDDRPVGDRRRPPPGDVPPDRRERDRRRPVPPPRASALVPRRTVRGSAGGSAAQRHSAPPPGPPGRLERRPLRLPRRRGHGRCAQGRGGAARPSGRSRGRLARTAKLGATAIPASRQPLEPLELSALRGSDIVSAYR